MPVYCLSLDKQGFVIWHTMFGERQGLFLPCVALFFYVFAWCAKYTSKLLEIRLRIEFVKCGNYFNLLSFQQYRTIYILYQWMREIIRPKENKAYLYKTIVENFHDNDWTFSTGFMITKHCNLIPFLVSKDSDI